MDKETIAQRAHALQSRNDLLALLNDMKRADAGANGWGDKCHPFTMRQLLYYCNPSHTSRYVQFKIKKKTGGFRQISAPRNRSFKVMLRYVNEALKALYTPSPYAMGFVAGRSVVSNASAHTGMNYVFNTDLKDFFPSITQARVWKRLQLPPFNFAPAVASVLAGLCAMQTAQLQPDGKHCLCVLPQGAPTSPCITNMVCDTLDRRLAGPSLWTALLALCRRHHL